MGWKEGKRAERKTYGVGRVGHGVERSNGEGELVEDKVVGLVLLPHERTEELLVLGAVITESKVSRSVLLQAEGRLDSQLFQQTHERSS